MKLNRTIRKCSLYFRRVCPLQWDALTPTADPNVRSCSACNKPVYFCATDEETLAHARLGDCVAREEPDKSELPKLVVGEPNQVLPSTESQEKARAWTHREQGVCEAISSQISPSDRLCPECSYPVADWLPRCRVCGFEIGRVRA
jgi:hypothetical protein